MPHPKGGYRLNGKRVPGVTTIIGRFDDKENLIAWAFRCGAQGKDYKVESRRAANIGSAVHDGIEDCLLRRKTDWEVLSKTYSLDAQQLESVKKSYSAFYAWRAERRPVVCETEVDYVSTEHRYGGCPDAICTIGSDKVLCDWKTSKSLHKGHLVQVAAYADLWEQDHGEELAGSYILRLDKLDGSYQEVYLPRRDLDAYFVEFIAMRQLYDIKIKNGTVRYAKL